MRPFSLLKWLRSLVTGARTKVEPIRRAENDAGRLLLERLEDRVTPDGQLAFLTAGLYLAMSYPLSRLARRLELYRRAQTRAVLKNPKPRK